LKRTVKPKTPKNTQKPEFLKLISNACQFHISFVSQNKIRNRYVLCKIYMVEAVLTIL